MRLRNLWPKKRAWRDPARRQCRKRAVVREVLQQFLISYRWVNKSLDALLSSVEFYTSRYIMNQQNLTKENKIMNRKLEGKIALITGGSRGIGGAIAKRLASDGANVAITYSKGADAAAAVVKEIERDGGKAIAMQADAIDAEAVKAAVEKTVATFGKLDVLVNNAGTAIPKTFKETTLEEMDRVLNINVRGVFIATQAALKHMKSGGRIIMIGS